jgi:hypothetical protein
MRITDVLRAASVTIMAATVGADGMQRRPDGGLYFSVLVADYYDVEYLQEVTAPARYVVFAGERLELEVSIGNRGSVDEDLATRKVALEDAITVSSLRLPPGAAVPRIAVSPQGRQESAGTAADVTWDSDLRVPSKGEVKLRASIDIPVNAPAGVYELGFTPRFSGVTTTVAPLAHILRFAVRAGITFEERVDMARRRMFRHYNRENFVAAEAEADRLLEMHPTSWFAYEVKGRAAEVRGESQRAISAYERARVLLAQGEDRLWLTHAPPYKVKGSLERLTERIQSVGKKVQVIDKH